MLLVPAASAQTTQPVVYSGNPGCADIDQDFGESWLELKIEPIRKGTTNFSNGDISGSITADDDVKSFSFTVTPGVDAVIVKGGPNSNAYVYAVDTTSGSGLVAPGGSGLSHIDFCYDLTGSISGIKWHDLDADGVQDAGEPTLAGWKLYLDLDNDGDRDANEPIAITDANGAYTFGDLAFGTYTVRELPASEQSNTALTLCSSPVPCSFTFTLTSDNRHATGNFGNHAPAPTPAGAINILKTGTATADHGDLLTYDFAVTNVGNSPLHDVVVTDDKCAPVTGPVSRTNDDGDALLESPGVDGVNSEVWNYTCSYNAPAQHVEGEANPIHNVATATAKDETDKTVTDTDDHDTVLLHPTTPTTPPGPPAAPGPQAAPAPQATPAPTIEVLPSAVISGVSRLTGPTGCVTKRFTARVTGRRIASVVFRIDGKVVKRFRSVRGEATKVNLRVNPARYGRGNHRLTIRVTYNPAAQTAAKTLRMTFARCSRAGTGPRFTG